MGSAGCSPSSGTSGSSLTTTDSGSALVFETVVDGVSVNGIDLIRTNDDGLISELTVMVRPLSASNALATAMAAQFDQIVAEASGASS